jgi:hypothetical protein
MELMSVLEQWIPPLIASATASLGGSIITIRTLTAVMDQKLSDVTRRVATVEDKKLDTAVHEVIVNGIQQRIGTAEGEIKLNRERYHDLSTVVQRHMK